MDKKHPIKYWNNVKPKKDDQNNKRKQLSVLLATNHLYTFTGSELTLYTLAKYLKKKGHEVSVYAKYMNPSFIKKIQDIAPVSNSLHTFLKKRFDAAYVQHHPIALEIRYMFPNLPILLASLGVLPYLEQPPLVDLNIYKYLAISEEVRSNLLNQDINASDIEIFRNIIDSKKFRPTRPINSIPRKAIVFSYKINSKKLDIVLKACESLGIESRHIGTRPGEIDQNLLTDEINKVDIVFTLGRGIIETMMCERIPIVFDYQGGDGIVTPENIHEIMTHNFSGRCYKRQYKVEDMINEIKKYNPLDGSRLRAMAVELFDADRNIDKLVSWFIDSTTKSHLALTNEKIKSIGSLIELIKVTKEHAENNFAMHQPFKANKMPLQEKRFFSVKNKEQNSITARVSSIKPIAFYLPQYHPIPENDKWWGKGFTEWTNVAKAKPLFTGHYQPHVPADLGFYDLRLPETRNSQAELAQEYGIYGFCYYHYWFNGKLLLDYPLQQVIKSGEPDFPFCLCWANENWTRAWDGRNGDVLIKQDYSEEDDINHIRWLLKVFKDKRYIRINNKPLMHIYMSSSIPDIEKTMETWRREAGKEGEELYLSKIESAPWEYGDPSLKGFDAGVEFQPDWGNLGPAKRKLPEDHTVYEYKDVVERMLDKPVPPYKYYPCVTPMWDNSARRKKASVILNNSTPALYEKWLGNVIKKIKAYNLDEDIIYLNAWNEWGEGNHLEPDIKYGRAYLEATKRALARTGDYRETPEAKFVSIIIPLESSLRPIKECIHSIQEYTHKPHEIIFVSKSFNNSTGKYLRGLRKNNENIQLINSEESLNTSAGINLASRKAKGHYILLIKDNTLVTEGWLDMMTGCLDRNPNIGIAVPLSNVEKGPQTVKNVIYDNMSAMQEFAGDLSAASQENIAELVNLAGRCMLIRKEVLCITGGLDENYTEKSYKIDDLCLGSLLADFKNIIANDVLIHNNDTSLGHSSDYETTLFDLEYFAQKWQGIIKINDNGYIANLTQESKRNKLIEWGEAMLARGDNKTAVEIFKRVYRFVKNDYKALNNLGVIQWQLGEKESAINSFEAAVKINPKDKDSVSNFLQAAKECGRVDLISSTLPVIEAQINSAA